MPPRNSIHSPSGQTSLEVLFVISFVIVFSMAISLPYVTNQTKTNISIQTKLAILPLIEKNPHLVHISSILPEIDSGNLLMNITTQGEWDASVNADDYCSAVCPLVDPDDYYANVDIAWVHNDVAFCSQTC